MNPKQILKENSSKSDMLEILRILRILQINSARHIILSKQIPMTFLRKIVELYVTLFYSLSGLIISIGSIQNHIDIIFRWHCLRCVILQFNAVNVTNFNISNDFYHTHSSHFNLYFVKI